MIQEQWPDISFVVSDTNELLRPAATRRLREYLVTLVEDRFPPSVSLAVLDGSGVVLEAFGGYSCVVGDIVPTTAETCYDLASLTKVVCTVTLALIARQRGIMGLDEPVVNYLPGFPEKSTTMRHLLTHTSGLVDHRPFFRHGTGRRRDRGCSLRRGGWLRAWRHRLLFRSQLHAPRLGARGMFWLRSRRGVRDRGGAAARDATDLFLPAGVGTPPDGGDRARRGPASNARARLGGGTRRERFRTRRRGRARGTLLAIGRPGPFRPAPPLASGARPGAADR